MCAYKISSSQLRNKLLWVAGSVRISITELKLEVELGNTSIKRLVDRVLISIQRNRK